MNKPIVPCPPPQPPLPPKPPNGDSALDLCKQTVETQARTIRYLLQNYEALLRKVEHEHPNGIPPGPGPHPQPQPWQLQGGDYPLGVGNVAPTTVKVWFNTATSTLVVWNYQTTAWQPASSTVAVSTTAPTPATLGLLWLDGNHKLWVHIDDWRELTDPVQGAPTVANGALMLSSFNPPPSPASGNLWFEPRRQDLSMWNGFTWAKVGQRVQRRLRFGNYANTWNAGGNRSQSAVGGDILFLSGMRGIDPATQQQLPGPGPQNQQGTVAPNLEPNGNLRIDQIYQNIKVIAEAEGLSLYDCFGLDTYMCSAAYISPTAAQQALPQFWGTGPYPCRTHIVMLQMSGSDTEAEFPAVTGWPPRGDIVEVTALFYTGRFGKRKPTMQASEILAIPGVQMGTGLPQLGAPPGG